MISTCKITNVIGSVAKSLLNVTPNLCTQQIRTTIILKRKYPLPLYKKGGRPVMRKNKNFIYDVVEYTHMRKKENINVILTQFVDGYGEKGDKISLKPAVAYNNFLLPKLAVYASPENIEKYWIKKSEQKKTYSSINVPQLMKILKQCCLPVNMSIENPWVIEKWHIKTNFRKIGVQVPEHAITLPGKEIAGPNLDYEGKEFYVTITINKTEQVMVRCRLHHDTFDLSKQLPFVEEHWKIPGEALFPEDQEILDSLPRPKWEEEKKKKL